MAEFSILSRGMEIPCRNAVYRPAICAPRTHVETVASSLLATYPRHWKLQRGCKIRTPAGDFIATAVPHPGGIIRIEGKNVDLIARAIGV